MPTGVGSRPAPGPSLVEDWEASRCGYLELPVSSAHSLGLREHIADTRLGGTGQPNADLEADKNCANRISNGAGDSRYLPKTAKNPAQAMRPATPGDSEPGGAECVNRERHGDPHQ
jgi:hypothetical protein